MTFVMTNRGLHTIGSTAISGATDIRALVCSDAGTPTDAQIEDLNFVSELGGIGLVEVTNTGYARLDLAGVAIAEDDTNNWSKITATAPTTAPIQAGNVWKRVVYFIFNASDAAAVVLGIDTPAVTVTPNGGTITLPALEIRLTDVSV
jgi:hypothetical protein